MSYASIFFLSFFFVFIFPFYAQSRIVFDEDGKWSTTFDYGPCAQRGLGGETDCDRVRNDNIEWSWGALARDGGTYTQVTPDANYPGGLGGNGARFWNYDGHNRHSGPIRILFPGPQKEIWIRWYMRYQEGFRWNTGTGHLNENPPLTEHYIHFNKTFIIRTGTGGSDVVPYFGNEFWWRIQNHPNVYYSGGGWDDSFGPGLSDGRWHCFEIYMKMNSEPGSKDGQAMMWLNGELKGKSTNIIWDNGNEVAHRGWTWLDFNNNQSRVENLYGPIGLTYAYIDYDDMVFYNKKPPNVDNHENPFIGPIGWGAVKDYPLIRRIIIN